MIKTYDSTKVHVTIDDVKIEAHNFEYDFGLPDIEGDQIGSPLWSNIRDGDRNLEIDGTFLTNYPQWIGYKKMIKLLSKKDRPIRKRKKRLREKLDL